MNDQKQAEETTEQQNANSGASPGAGENGGAAPENGGEAPEVFLEQEPGPADESAREQLLRLRADYENFRRRSAKERAQERQRGRRDAAEKLLPVFDSLAAALIALKADDPSRKGLEAVFNQLLTAFAQVGIKKVMAKGSPFNPELMEAVAQVPHPTVAEGHVIDESRPGFTDEVGLLRPAQVIVSAGSA